jgi:hypothetical protein
MAHITTLLDVSGDSNKCNDSNASTECGVRGESPPDAWGGVKFDDDDDDEGEEEEEEEEEVRIHLGCF